MRDLRTRRVWTSLATGLSCCKEQRSFPLTHVCSLPLKQVISRVSSCRRAFLHSIAAMPGRHLDSAHLAQEYPVVPMEPIAYRCSQWVQRFEGWRSKHLRRCDKG